MQVCFTFANLTDAEKLECFLAQQFKVKHYDLFGQRTLFVPKKEYKDAIKEGLKFVDSRNIRSGWWIDNDSKRIPLNIVPLLRAEIPALFQKHRKLTEMFCHKYALSYSKFLGVPVSFEFTAGGNVRFDLVRCQEVNEHHEYYMSQITKYCLLHMHIFKYIAVCDSYGKYTAIINRTHSVEQPTKTPL